MRCKLAFNDAAAAQLFAFGRLLSWNQLPMACTGKEMTNTLLLELCGHCRIVCQSTASTTSAVVAGYPVASFAYARVGGVLCRAAAAAHLQTA